MAGRYEVPADRFEEQVIAASREKPVVVDFWAAWCGPCRVLGPVLEELAERADGRWVLAKVNVDEAPHLAARYGVQGIPAVKLFRDGEPVAEFVGALPRHEVERWLERHVPSGPEPEVLRAAAFRKGGAPERAAEVLEPVLAGRPSAAALVEAARIALALGRGEEGLRHLARLDPEDRAARAEEVARLSAALRSLGVERAQVEAAVASGEASAEQWLALGRVRAADGDWEPALAALLEAVRRDRGAVREQARQEMLEIFEAVGPRSELADTWRRKLAMELY